jgi:hypothetical protein
VGRAAARLHAQRHGVTRTHGQFSSHQGWLGQAVGTAGPGGQATGAEKSRRPRLGQVPSAMREKNHEDPGECGIAAESSFREIGCGVGGGDTDGLGGEPLPSRRPAFPCWDKSHRRCRVQIMMNCKDAEELPIFLLEGLVVDLVRGTQMGRVGK